MNKKYFYQAAMVSTLATAAFVAAAPQADAAFIDVAPNTEAATAIDKLVAMKIVSGYEDGTFKPKNQVTRAEAAKILTLLNTNSTPVPYFESDFSDVDYEHWANKYVSYASGVGLLNGYGGGVFGASDVLTRAQFAKIISSQLGKTAPDVELPFTDVAADAWYAEGIKVLMAEGITKGTSATTFSPDQPITREQLAIFLDRAKLLNVTTLPINSIDDLTDTDKTYDAATFSEVVRLVNEEQRSFYSLNGYQSPNFELYENTVFGVRSGTFTYLTYESYDSETPSHIFMVTFTDKGVDHFSVTSFEKYKESILANTKGPRELERMLLELKKETGSEYVYFNAGDYDLGKLYLDKYLTYFDFSSMQPRVHLANYEDSNGEKYGAKAYALKPTFDGHFYDYEIEEVSSMLDVQEPEGLRFSIAWVTLADDDDAYHRLTDAVNSDGLVSFYAIDDNYSSVKNGTQIEIRFFEDETYEEYAYIYEYQNGFQLISTYKVDY